MDIVVHSMDQISTYIPDPTKKHIAIRIEETDFALFPLFAAELHLHFADITAEDLADFAAQGMVDSFTLFGEQHVYQVLSFLHEHEDADVLHIHCHAGMSRSPALAIAIARHLGIPEDAINYRKKSIIPNPTVLDVFSSVIS